jgi:integrase
VRHTLTIVSSLFEWLVRVQYFAFNPWDVVGKKPASQADAPEDLELTRVFSEAQWQYLNDHLATKPDDPHARRLRFVLPFAYATGLRLSELVDAMIGRLYTMPVRNSIRARWMLKVRGKGGKWRAVPLPDSVLSSLRQYLSQRGRNSDPQDNPPETPLIANLNGIDAVACTRRCERCSSLPLTHCVETGTPKRQRISIVPQCIGYGTHEEVTLEPLACHQISFRNYLAMPVWQPPASIPSLTTSAYGKS